MKMQQDSKVATIDLTQAVVLDTATQWATNLLTAIQGHVIYLTMMQVTDLHQTLQSSPINVSFDRVNCNAFRKRQTALLLSTEKYFYRCLWVVYDKIKQPDSETWKEYLVVMYSNRVSEEDEEFPQEGILARYAIPPELGRSEHWLGLIAGTIVMNLYREHKYEPLSN